MSALEYRCCREISQASQKLTLVSREFPVLPNTEFVEGTGYETRQTSKRDLFVRVLT